MEPVNPIRLSYAQNYEDVLLWRALGHIKEGCYLDIGACDPIADSVSKAFYLAGWRGVHVDPSVTCADALRKDRPDEIVIQAVVADEPGFVTFYEFPDTGLSTCVEEFADRHRAAGHVCEVSTAPVIALAELLDLAAGPDLHWLKIDVEGFERKVLSSWGQSFVRPWVLVIESTEPNSQIQTQCEWLDLVHELGYHEVTFDGLSRFFVSDAHCELDAAFIANPNIFDSFNVTERHFSSRALVGEWRTERDRLIAAMTNCEAQAAVDRDAFEQLLTAAHEQVEAGHAAAYALQKELQEAAMRAESLALDNASLTLERGDLERAMQDRAIEVARLTATADAISQERDRLVSEAGAFYDKLASQKADFEAIEQLLADVRLDNASLTLERGDLERAMQDRAIEVASLAATADAISQERDRLVSEAGAFYDKLASQKADYEAIEQLLADVRLDNASLTAERGDLERSMQARAIEVASLAATADAISQERDRLVSEAGAFYDKLASQKADFEAIEKLLADVRLDNASLTLERGDLERAMQDRAIEVAQFEVSEQLLRSQYEISQALVIALQDDLAAERRAGEERMAEFHHELSERNRSLQGAKKIISEAAEFLTSSIILAIRPSARRHLRAMRHELDEWPSLNLPYLTAEYQSDSYTTLSHNTEPRDINMSIFDVDMRDPYHRAESLANLCAFADLDFVRCAFVTILGRQPDPEGEAYYLARLRSGVAKLSILRQLRNSQEGRNHDPGIAGLDRALRRHRNASRPFFGLLIRWVTRREGDSIVQRPLRALENQQALEARRAALRFLHINHLLHELDGSIDSLHHNVQQLQLRGGSSSINISQKIAADSSDWRSSLTAAIKS